jgi:hypothetical protein
MSIFLSQLQEYSACQLEDAIFTNYILNGILLLIPSYFVSYVQTGMSKQLPENRHIHCRTQVVTFPSISQRSRQK